jgi:hypothetical protein
MHMSWRLPHGEGDHDQRHEAMLMASISLLAFDVGTKTVRNVQLESCNFLGYEGQSEASFG